MPHAIWIRRSSDCGIKAMLKRASIIMEGYAELLRFADQVVLASAAPLPAAPAPPVMLADAMKSLSLHLSLYRAILRDRGSQIHRRESALCAQQFVNEAHTRKIDKRQPEKVHAGDDCQRSIADVWIPCPLVSLSAMRASCIGIPKSR